MTAKVDAKTDVADRDGPDWFDDALHIHRDNGIYERKTGLFLAGDGLPYAGGVRLARLVAAGKTTDPLGLVDDDMIANQTRHHAELAKAEAAATPAPSVSKPAPEKSAAKPAAPDSAKEG